MVCGRSGEVHWRQHSDLRRANIGSNHPNGLESLRNLSETAKSKPAITSVSPVLYQGGRRSLAQLLSSALGGWPEFSAAKCSGRGSESDRRQAARRTDRGASNRSSSVAATRLWEPNGAAIGMPRAAAESATRSVMRPCARNHGATTSRRAPRRRSRCGGLGHGRVRPGGERHLDAGPPRAGRAAPRRTVAVRAFAASFDEPTAVTMTPRSAVIGRHANLGQALPEQR